MKIEYKGYVISQSNYNNHIMITKDNKMVMHIQATKKMTEEELKEALDLYYLLSKGD